MFEFLNNLFGGAPQQLPYSVRNPESESANPFDYAQEVYNRQIAPWMRPGRQSPMDQMRFEPMPAAMPPQMGMDATQAAQQQELLKQYAMANMGRVGGQSGIVEQRQPIVEQRPPMEYPPFATPPYAGYPPGMDPRSPENLLKEVLLSGTQPRTFPVEMNQLPTPEEIPARQSQEGFLETMFAGGEEPMLSQLMRAGMNQDVGVDVGGAQAAPMTREAMGYIPTGIETLIPGANTMGIDFRNVVMNPARKRLSNLLGIQ